MNCREVLVLIVQIEGDSYFLNKNGVFVAEEGVFCGEASRDIGPFSLRFNSEATF